MSFSLFSYVAAQNNTYWLKQYLFGKITSIKNIQCHVKNGLAVCIILTLIILSLWTDTCRSGQRMLKYIRMILEDQSDLGLYRLQFCINHLVDT